MNIARAKSVPLEDILKRYGHEPSARKGADLWYLSPFRRETTASFVVNTHKNVWYDHGEGQGGTVIDLVSRLSGEPNVGRVLGIVGELVRGIVPMVARPTETHHQTTYEDGARVVSATDIVHPALIRYLASRGLSVHAASPYLREVRYEAKGRTYFGLGFRNDAGGYEIRSERFKGCVGHKGITVIGAEPSGTVSIFEGFMDFLSWLELSGERPTGTTVVLNSVALLDRALPIIAERGGGNVRCFFDTDAAGRKAFDRLSQTLQDITLTDMAGHYQESQDVNAELQKRRARRAEL